MKRALILAILLPSCASERQALKGGAWPAGFAAAGAAVGSLAGPVGTIAGAGIGGGVGHLVGENAGLRSGELTGEGAAEAWRGEAIKQADSAGFFQACLRRALYAVAGYLAFRNREHLIAALRQKSLGPLLHALIGGSVGKAAS